LCTNTFLTRKNTKNVLKKLFLGLVIIWKFGSNYCSSIARNMCFAGPTLRLSEWCTIAQLPEAFLFTSAEGEFPDTSSIASCDRLPPCHAYWTVFRNVADEGQIEATKKRNAVGLGSSSTLMSMKV